MTVPAQRRSPRRKTRNADLVLEGGGVKGIGLVGAVLTLDDVGFTFPRVAGTSAGAIAAALVAALQRSGKPLSLLKGYVESVEYTRFMNASTWMQKVLGHGGDVPALMLHEGMYDGDYLVEWLGGLLEDIGITTFGQLRIDDDAGSALHRNDDTNFSLVVHTADVTRSKLVRLPWDYRAYGLDPDKQLIVDAVRASMSIPFFFRPVHHDAPAATFGDTDWPAGPVTWVDGGLLSNFPVEVFDRSDGVAGRWPTIGVKLSAVVHQQAAHHDPHTAVQEAMACLHTLLDNADRIYLTKDKVQRTIFVDNAQVKATDFHLPPEKRDELYANGVKAAQAFLAAVPDGPAASRPQPVVLPDARPTRRARATT